VSVARMSHATDDSRATIRFGWPHIWYSHVTSTMDVAARLAERGAPHGTVVEAAFQSAGRGRQGRGWEAPAGHAFLSSWILRVSTGHDSAVLSPLIALALLRALGDLTTTAPLGYKWPNDVFIGDRKVAGILLTSRHRGAEAVVIAGVGVNLIRPPNAPAASAWLENWLPGATAVALRVTLGHELDTIMERYRSGPGLCEDDRDALEATMVWRDREVEVHASTGIVRGRMRGLALDGSLILTPTGGGKPILLRSGEVTRGPRPSAQNPPGGAVYFPERESDDASADAERPIRNDGFFTDGRAGAGT
jgi:BirA family transcriptional regulator, biotin operon repressor / biotin---[acetyl-CoA-carboxylase] ligase